MNTLQLSKENQDILVQEIYSFAKEYGLSNGRNEPITDGVSDIKKYLASFPKIMWMLKEPHDRIIKGKPSRGGWSIIDDCFDKIDAKAQPTWQVITYVSFGYVNHLKWKDMDLIRNNPSMVQILKQIAYINVSKMPATTISNKASIGKSYRIWKPILNKQISLYNPDIIIFGNTFSHFKEDVTALGATLIEDKSFVGLKIYKLNNRILIDAYHPRQRKLLREVYVDSIIEILNKYYPIK